MMQVLNGYLLAARAYNLLSSFFPAYEEVCEDSDDYSPMLSLERLLTIEQPLDKESIVGIGHTLYTTRSIVSWSCLIRLPLLNDRDQALKRWSQWFSKKIKGGKALIDEHDQQLKSICGGTDESDCRVLLNANGRSVVNENGIWWRPLRHLFLSDKVTLTKRYNNLSFIVSKADGALPKDGIAILNKLWIIGCEWEVRKEMETDSEPTPYRELNDYLQQLHNDEKGELKLGPLSVWAKKIEADSPSISFFHCYLRQVILNLHPSTFTEYHCNKSLAQLELALQPNLKRLFSQVDAQHQRWVAEVKDGVPVVIDEKPYSYKQCMYDNIHIFACKEGDERLLVFGMNNCVELYLAYARMQSKKCIHLFSDSLSFFEIEYVKPIEWAKETPKGVSVALKRLGETMPRHLNKTLCIDKRGMACWLPTEDRVPLCAATIEVFLFECSEKECSAWMKGGGLLATGKTQRSKVIKACSDKTIELSPIEWEAKGAFSYAMQIHNLCAKDLEAALIKEGCVLRLPDNLADYADLK